MASPVLAFDPVSENICSWQDGRTVLQFPQGLRQSTKLKLPEPIFGETRQDLISALLNVEDRAHVNSQQLVLSEHYSAKPVTPPLDVTSYYAGSDNLHSDARPAAGGMRPFLPSEEARIRHAGAGRPSRKSFMDNQPVDDVHFSARTTPAPVPELPKHEGPATRFLPQDEIFMRLPAAAYPAAFSSTSMRPLASGLHPASLSKPYGPMDVGFIEVKLVDKGETVSEGKLLVRREEGHEPRFAWVGKGRNADPKTESVYFHPENIDGTLSRVFQKMESQFRIAPPAPNASVGSKAVPVALPHAS